MHGGDGREHELVLRTGSPGDPGGGPDHDRDGGRGAGLNAGLELEAASQRAAAAAGMPVPAVLCASDRRERPRLPVPDQRPGSR